MNLAIHHTAVYNDGSPQLYAVNRYHRDKDWGGGWKQQSPSNLGWYVAYNYFIDVDGTLTQCREHDEEQLAQKGHNCDAPERCDTISVCLAGNFNSHMPREAQIASLRGLYRSLGDNYQIKFHRDLQANRTCPGTLVTKEYIHQVLAPNDDIDEEKEEEIIKLQKSLIDLLLKWLESLKSQSQSPSS